jgi:hypothetical protein
LQVRIEQAIADRCRNDFYTNRCDVNDLPALVDYCSEKEICMNTVPLQSAITLRALTKHTTVLINTFTEHLTYKSILVVLVVFFVYMRFRRTRPPFKETKFPVRDFSIAVD